MSSLHPTNLSQLLLAELANFTVICHLQFKAKKLELSVFLPFCMGCNFIVWVHFTNKKHDHLPRFVLDTVLIPGEKYVLPSASNDLDCVTASKNKNKIKKSEGIISPSTSAVVKLFIYCLMLLG